MSAICQHLVSTWICAVPRLEARVEGIESRKRPRKQRKLPDPDRPIAQLRVAEERGKLDRLGQAISSTEASQHRRASLLVERGADQELLAVVERAIGDRVRDAVDRTIEDPPAYLRTLGPRPRERDDSRAWEQAVIEVETCRVEHGVTAPDLPAGLMPDAGEERRQWSRAIGAISDFLDRSTARHAVARAAPERSIEIDL